MIAASMQEEITNEMRGGLTVAQCVVHRCEPGRKIIQ